MMKPTLLSTGLAPDIARQVEIRRAKRNTAANNLALERAKSPA